MKKITISPEDERLGRSGKQEIHWSLLFDKETKKRKLLSCRHGADNEYDIALNNCHRVTKSQRIQ